MKLTTLWLVFVLSLVVLVLALLQGARATWKPVYGESPQAWVDWFNSTKLTPEAAARLGWQGCCAHSDRFVTSFKHDDHWYYKVGESWVQIPDDTVEDPDPTEPAQLKEEGVLFIYAGKVTCFYKPESGT